MGVREQADGPVIQGVTRRGGRGDRGGPGDKSGCDRPLRTRDDVGSEVTQSRTWRVRVACRWSCHVQRCCHGGVRYGVEGKGDGKDEMWIGR